MSNLVSTITTRPGTAEQAITPEAHNSAYDYFADQLLEVSHRVAEHKAIIAGPIGKFTVETAAFGDTDTLETEVALLDEAIAKLMPPNGPSGTRKVGLLDIAAYKGRSKGLEYEELAYVSYVLLSSGEVALRALDIAAPDDTNVGQLLQRLQVADATDPATQLPLLLDGARTQALADHLGVTV